MGEPYETRIAELRADGRLNDTVITHDEISEALVGTTVTLPNPYLPSLVPFVSLMTMFCLHALLLLMQIWSMRFNAFLNYSETKFDHFEKASHVLAIPHIHCGKSEIVPLLRTHDNIYYFIFQRHKYIFSRNEKNETVITKVKPNVKRSIKYFVESKGFQTDEEINKNLENFGENIFTVTSPTFKELYLQQLVQPITVFQVFCTLLWMLDEYWQYSLFSGAMIFLFEAVTVFGRMKSMSVIKGMSSTSRLVYVKRKNEWSQIPTEKLLPGDLISLRTDDAECPVPCDCLLLKGIAVVNEASLTGESHPQLKEEINIFGSESDAILDMHGLHKYNIFFGGTTLLQHKHFKENLLCDDDDKSEKKEIIESPISETPDEGCLCVVLRTGFNSSQGKLVSMIENSTEEVRDDSFDSMFLVIFLLIFAFIASGYVLKKGLENKERSNFELLLHCIMIITCVIPPSLPMQTAMTVNSAVLTLMKLNIFCTEPFRIPTAGKVDICLFDKTGTITSDQLSAVGIINVDKDNSVRVLELQPVLSASYEASLILGSCHALMSINGKISGDPLEEASLKSIDFSFNSSTNRCSPIEREQTVRQWPKEVNDKRSYTEIIHRNHFASKLQRMSVIARVYDGYGPVTNSKFYSLVKGSPEIIETLLANERPSWYWDTYHDLTSRGMRVIALAYKKIDTEYSLSELSKLPRSEVESNLIFVAFIAFRCLVRKDSKDVLGQLITSSHKVVMITGDAVLTASYVADEVGIVKSKKVLVLESKEDTEDLCWTRKDVNIDYKSYNDFNSLSEKYDLCVSGKTLSIAIKKDPTNIFAHIHKIKIFARMVPELKELVIKKLKENNYCCLMCGDGANDVGALRQSNVGVALLSGFGSLNVDKSLPKPEDKNQQMKEEEKKKLEAQKLQEEKDNLENLKKKRAEELELKKQQVIKKIEEEIKIRTERDETCAALRGTCSVFRQEFSEVRQQSVADREKGLAGNAAMKQSLEKYLNEMGETDVPIIKLGDASIASPFTSKVPSIQSVVDIIRQGRCALVTRIQMYQILALNCLISAYSLSVLYLDGIKYGDQQMTASGVLLTISFLTLSNSSPLKDLSKERPFLSIFQPALFFSLIGQIIIHTGVMWYSTTLAKEVTAGGWKPNIGGKFEPNLLNSVVFLVSTVQSVSVFAVNYKGRPFMDSMTDKPGLLYSLGACIVGVVLATSESLPVLNKILQLVPFPSTEFAESIMYLLGFNVIACFLWDTLMMFLFSRDILNATLKAITKEDIRKFMKMALVIYCMIYFFTPTEENYELIKEEIAKQNIST